MPKLFVRFEEIETEIKEKAPRVVYKYRDWKDANHQRLLTNQELWFAHPFKMNDPLDVRPDVQFDLDELNDPNYLNKMIASAGMNTDRDNNVRAENQLEIIRQNPHFMLENQKAFNAKEANFDTFGVFSTAKTELNDHLWQEYSNKHSGFCIGFNTVELCRQVKSGFGFVTYSDKPFVYRFLNKRDDDPDMLYYKKKKWEVEDEFRFITAAIGRGSERVQTFSTNTATELLVGYNILLEHEKTILDTVKKQYQDLPVYKTRRNADTSSDLNRRKSTCASGWRLSAGGKIAIRRRRSDRRRNRWPIRPVASPWPCRR